VKLELIFGNGQKPKIGQLFKVKLDGCSYFKTSAIQKTAIQKTCTLIKAKTTTSSIEDTKMMGGGGSRKRVGLHEGGGGAEGLYLLCKLMDKHNYYIYRTSYKNVMYTLHVAANYSKPWS